MKELFKFDVPDDSGGEGEVSGTDADTATDNGSDTNTAPVATEQQPTVDELSFSSIVGEDGKLVDGWQSVLGEEYKDNATLKKFNTFDGMVKSHINLEKMIGRKPDEIFEEMKAKDDFYDRLGKPESPDKYWIDKPENHPDDAPYDENQVKWFANIAHKHNLTEDQFKGLREEFYNLQMTSWEKANQDSSKANEEAVKALEEKWGKEGSETYRASMENANKAIDALEKLGDGNVRKEIEEMGLGNYPRLFELLAKIGTNVGEDMIPNAQANSLGMTKDQVNARIAEINANPAYTQFGHPQQAELKKEMEKLFKALHPGE